MVEYVVGRVVSDEAAPLPRGTAERSVGITIAQTTILDAAVSVARGA